LITGWSSVKGKARSSKKCNGGKKTYTCGALADGPNTEKRKYMQRTINTEQKKDQGNEGSTEKRFKKGAESEGIYRKVLVTPP